MATEKRERGIAVKRAEPRHLLPWPEDMERLFDRTLGGFGFRSWRPFGRGPLGWGEGPFAPAVDVFVREGKLVVRADLPGMRREDIEVTVEGDALVIRGSRKEEKEVKEEDYYRAERVAGEFYRAMTLPKGVKTENIEAMYQDGVLEVTFPAPATPEARKLKVAIK